MAACLLAAGAGCRSLHPGNANQFDRGPEPVQSAVEDKLREQRRGATGDERWASFRENAYQDDEDLDGLRGALSDERIRAAEAGRVIESGPVTIEQCLAFSLEFNDRIQSRRAAIRAVGGEELIARSRFLPSIRYTVDHLDAEQTGGTNRTVQAIRLEQVLFEFGKDSVVDVVLREAQRAALFAYEDTVRDVLSEVRRRFYTVLLRRLQIEQRETLLEEFRQRHQEMQSLLETRRVPEVDVLTARLNMLNEEARINALEKERIRQKIELAHALGFPVALYGVPFHGRIERAVLDVENAVEISLRRSATVAQARAAVEEQERVARQVRAEYLPDLALRAGWQGRDNVGGFEVGGTNGFYRISAVGEAGLDVPEEGWGSNRVDVAVGEEDGFFAALSLELPIFEGWARAGRTRREQATLDRRRHELRNTVEQVEVSVRTAYQTILEEGKELELREETVRISRERLRTQDRLKELGKISADQLETFRNRFFDDQDAYFDQQIRLIEVQEALRAVMRYFEPLPGAAGPEEETSGR